jgi:hypothetical protein
MRYLTPVPKQFVDHSGIPYSDGTVSVYLSGDSEFADIYEDADGDALYPNPCKLDANGAWQCFVPGGVPLDYIVKDKNGNVIASYLNVMIDAASGESLVTKEYVDACDNEIRESVVEVSRAVEDERERAILSESEESAAREAGDAANAGLIADEKNKRVSADKKLENKIEQGDADERAALETHKSDYNNPHHVTAHQVGAYTQRETEDRISDALSGEVGGWLGNLTVAEVNSLTEHKKGDSATMLDAGTVMPGNVTVDVGDDIMWVDSLGVWQPKIADHLHHDETLVGTGSASDPLGVNIEEIATVEYVDGKGLIVLNGQLRFM